MRSAQEEQLIARLKALGVVKKQDVTLKYAGKSGYYINIKEVYGYPEIVSLICAIMHSRIPNDITCIAACGYGGLSLGGALSVYANLKFALVREKPKAHGMNVWIDGYVPGYQDKIWIVDDVFTTGKSVEAMVDILTQQGSMVAGGTVVARRTENKIKIPCEGILNLSDLVDEK